MNAADRRQKRIDKKSARNAANPIPLDVLVNSCAKCGAKAGDRCLKTVTRANTQFLMVTAKPHPERVFRGLQ